jgi:UDP-3-O-[3-hydroxymyristoyl] glucosamine N-acyltransferase
MTLQDLVEELGGRLVHGDPQWIADGVSSADKASAFDVVFADNEKSVSEATKCNAGAIVVKPGALKEYPHGKTVIETPQPKLWFAKAAKLLKKPLLSVGIAPGAVVSPDVKLDPAVVVGSCAVVGSQVKIGAGTHIGAGAIIGDGVKIGMDCEIYPRAVIYRGTTLGNRVVVHAGAVLGADGFGYVRDEKSGVYTQFPQQGVLVIEDDVEIGANSTIDRGALKETRIRKGTKIDNLVHVGHNCDIGENVILVALTGISGSSTIGRGAVLAGQVGIGDHVKVGPGVILGGQAGVFNGKTITNEGHRPGTVMFGTPARPLKQVLREQATLAKLTEASRHGEKQDLPDSGQATT